MAVGALLGPLRGGGALRLRGGRTADGTEGGVQGDVAAAVGALHHAADGLDLLLALLDLHVELGDVADEGGQFILGVLLVELIVLLADGGEVLGYLSC